MKLTKNQLKTWNSQQSDIDMFSKLENNFLQKFFRLNIVDYFEDVMLNIYETQCTKKVNNKNSKVLLNHLFRVEKSFMIHEFEQKIHSFYKHKSKSFESGQLQHAFKIRYCNWNPVPNMITKGQLILFDVKIKAQIQKLEKIPEKLIQTLQNTCRNDIYIQDQIIKKTFENYSPQYLNVFIVYFGDINFHLVNKKHYQKQSIKIFNKNVKLRIFTFFISKQALLETFRSMNKITTLDHINDLVIQYYQLKRQKKKQKHKKIKEEKQKMLLKSPAVKYLEQYSDYIKYAVGGFGVVAICIATYKFSSFMH